MSARRLCLLAAALLLAGLWLGPLPGLAARSFAAHMTLHVSVVALAAPLLALGLAGSRADPARHLPALFAPAPAAALDFALVWAWHAPALHQAARHTMTGFVLEQASYLGAGLLVWLAACGGAEEQRRPRAAAGAAGLLLMAMHMTLLGVLLALAGRPLYQHHGAAPWALSPLQDQQLGGVIMLTVGGLAYLLGGLALLAGLLRDAKAPELAAATAGEGRHG